MPTPTRAEFERLKAEYEQLKAECEQFKATVDAVVDETRQLRAELQSQFKRDRTDASQPRRRTPQ